MQVEEGEVGVEHSACCTGGTAPGQSEPGAAVGFEVEQRTAPSGCGKESPAAEAWESGGGRVQGSGQERRAAGSDAASWGSEGPAWVPQACWSDSVSEADRPRLPPWMVDSEVGTAARESRAAWGERNSYPRSADRKHVTFM